MDKLVKTIQNCSICKEFPMEYALFPVTKVPVAALAYRMLYRIEKKNPVRGEKTLLFTGWADFK